MYFSDVHFYRASYSCDTFRLKPLFSNIDGQKLNKERDFFGTNASSVFLYVAWEGMLNLAPNYSRL